MARQFAGIPGGIAGQKKQWLTLRQPTQTDTPAIGTEETRSAEGQPGSALAGRVQHLTWAEAETHAEAWRDLCERAAGPNAFLEPSFVLTAIRHSPPVARPSFLLVWGDDARTRLIGLAAVHFPDSANEPLVTFWSHTDTRLGGLLLDDVQDSEALNALVTWLAIEHPALRVLLCAGVRRDATVAAVLGSPSNRRLRLRVAESSQGKLHAHDPWRKTAPFTENLLVAPESLARESERGDLRASLEDFLLLDAASDSGGRMPLLDRAGFATFARAVTRQLSREGKCRIERLTLEGRLIASAIMMRSGRESFMWQFAHVRSPALRPAVRRFVQQIAQDDANAGLSTVLCCDAPEVFTDLPGFGALVTADVLVSPPGSEARDVTAALRRQTRQRFAREIGRHLLEIAGGVRRDPT